MSSSSSSSTATLASLQESGAIQGSLGNPVVVMLNLLFPDANRKVEAYKVDGITIQSHQRTAYMIRMQIDQQDANLYMAKVASGYPELENRAIMIEGPWRPFWSRDTAQFISQFTDAELGKVTSLEMKKAISKSCPLAKEEDIKKYWLLVFPEGVVLANSVFKAGDHTFLDINMILMKKDVNGGASNGGKTYYAMYAFWWIAEHNGASLLEVTRKKIDVDAMFDNL